MEGVHPEDDLLQRARGNDAGEDRVHPATEEAGCHTGEIETTQGTIRGIAVHIGAMYLPSPLTGLLVDRLGRKTVMVGSIIVYSFSPLAGSIR